MTTPLITRLVSFSASCAITLAIVAAVGTMSLTTAPQQAGSVVANAAAVRVA